MNAYLSKILNYINPVWLGLIILGVCTLVLSLILNPFPKIYSFDFFDKFLSPLLTVFTALMGFFIFIKQRVIKWEEELPKLYTSHTFCNGKLIISCYQFQTTSKHDIRQPLQSFLRDKLNDKINLSLDAGNQILKAEITNIGHLWYKQYLFVNSVEEIPNKMEESEYIFFKGGLSSKEYLQVSDKQIHTDENPNHHLTSRNGIFKVSDLPFTYKSMEEIIKNSKIEKSNQ